MTNSILKWKKFRLDFMGKDKIAFKYKAYYLFPHVIGEHKLGQLYLKWLLMSSLLSNTVEYFVVNMKIGTTI